MQQQSTLTLRRSENRIKPENINDGFTGGEAGPFELAILDLVAEYGLAGSGGGTKVLTIVRCK